MNKRDRNEIRAAVLSIVNASKADKPDAGWFTAVEFAEMAKVSKRTAHEYIRTMIDSGAMEPGRTFRVMNGGVIRPVAHYKLPQSVLDRTKR